MSDPGWGRENEGADLPEHLTRWPGLNVREGGRIVEAPADDQALARSYPYWSDKGSLIGGRRLTLMTHKSVYRVGEEIRIIHVVEVVEPGREVYIMGPKPVYGEYVNGQLVTEPPPEGADPLEPVLYDGAILESPAVDYNYDITSYRFSEPGRYEISWKLGQLQSNTLAIEVVES